MNIRFAFEEDKEKVKNLWRYSFSDTPEFIEYYFDQRYDKSNNILCFENNELSASVMLNPYKLWVGNICKNTSYIVGVSVEPEYRGLGHSSYLMKESIKALYNKGEDISILMPIDTKIYTRYGYINTFYRYEYETQLSNITVEKSKLKIRKVSLDNFDLGNQINDLIKLYDEATTDIYCKIARDEKYYTNKLQELQLDGGTMFAVYENEKMVASLILIPGYSPNHGMALELIFKNQAGFNSLMNLIKSHGTQFEKISIVTPQPEMFNRFVNYDNKYLGYKKPFMMSRIINGKNILEEINKSKKIKENIEIQLYDEIIEENNIIWESGENPKFKLKLRIEDLTSLYMKSISVKDLALTEKIAINKEEIDYLQDFFGEARHNNYINDYI